MGVVKGLGWKLTLPMSVIFRDINLNVPSSV